MSDQACTDNSREIWHSPDDLKAHSIRMTEAETITNGNAAFHAEKPLSSNPYETGSLLWAAWREGWRWGEAHAE